MKMMVVALIEISALTLFGNKTNNSLHASGEITVVIGVAGDAPHRPSVTDSRRASEQKDTLGIVSVSARFDCPTRAAPFVRASDLRCALRPALAEGVGFTILIV